MSREERRSYQRHMRTIDRTPSLPPAAKARAERNAAKRAAGRGAGPSTHELTRRYLVMAVLIALAVGYVTFSLLWPNMPFAALAGVAAAIVAFALAIGFRYAQRRAARH